MLLLCGHWHFKNLKFQGQACETCQVPVVRVFDPELGNSVLIKVFIYIVVQQNSTFVLHSV